MRGSKGLADEEVLGNEEVTVEFIKAAPRVKAMKSEVKGLG